MLEEAVFTQLIERIRADEPDTLAIVLHGSYARGTAGRYSDVDLDVILDSQPKIGYMTLLLEQERGRLLHVTIGFRLWTAWQVKKQAPAKWSFSLPVREPIRILWSVPELTRQQLEATYIQPAGTEETEDFLEFASKVKNAYLTGDELCLRLAAHNLAELCPSLLGPMNQVEPVSTQCEALKTMLSFSVAPSHYREDMLICLGLSGSATTIADVYKSALRLARGTLALVQANPLAITPETSPYIAQYLEDGSLLQYLEQ
ncbi:MAG TPA: nucleotidyltransferase domain-containing protein [Ktedonobacterales bacterium]|jgi:phosphoribosyl-AMP cyclohydrolase